MAFSKLRLTTFGNNAKSGVSPAIWIYYNSAGDTVTTAGYIANTYGLKAGDKVMVITATPANLPVWYYVSITSGVVSLIACS